MALILSIAATNPMEIFSNPIFWIVVTAASEIVGMSKLKSNSVVELILNGLMSIKPKGTK